MKHDTFIDIARQRLAMPNAPESDLIEAAVELMEWCGATVTRGMQYGMYHVRVAWDDYELRHLNRHAFPVLETFAEFSAIQEMRGDGMTVILDKPQQTNRIRIKGPGIKAINKASTSWFPVLRAYEIYQERKQVAS